jgi:hypothetical protein
MNLTHTNHADLEDFAINLIGVLGQVKDLKTEVSHLRNENQQLANQKTLAEKRIEMIKKALFGDQVAQPG